MLEKGDPYALSRFRGKVVLVVNTASKCGYTPHLKGLQALYNNLNDPETSISPENPASDKQGGSDNNKTITTSSTSSSPSLNPSDKGKESNNVNDFTILGFPCNQFFKQEPASDDSIQSFCQVNYGVTFPILAKTQVNGAETEPVWKWMRSQQPWLKSRMPLVPDQDVVRWNFEKFLIGRDGQVKQRWGPWTEPSVLEADIRKEIEKRGDS